MKPALSRFVALPGRRLHVLEWGRTGNPALVLVHGIRDHAHSWDWVATALADSYHILAPDLRGHGDSPWMGAYDLPDYVRDLADLVDALQLPAVHLIGHSLGGHICVRYAACFPDRTHSLCSIEGLELPIIRDQRRTPRTYPERLRAWIENEAARAVRAPRIYATRAEATARMAAAHPMMQQHVLAHLTLHGTTEQEGGGFRWKYDNAARFRAPEDAHGTDLDDILAAIRCPTWLAYGEESWIPVPAPQRVARIANHRVVVFPNASHWLHLQSHPLFLTNLQAFLASPANFVHSERA